ncbi:sodium/hydrogen exchanger 6 [Tanacetum coccineum]
MDDQVTQRVNELESERIKAMRALMQSSQDVVASLNATRVSSNLSSNVEDGAFSGIAPRDHIRVSSMARRPLNVLRDFNSSSSELTNEKSQVETPMATSSQLNSSIRVSQNPNEDSEVPRVYETVTTSIQDPVQSDGGPIGVSNYVGLFTSNSNTNATSLSESLTVNPSNVVDSGSVEEMLTNNPSGGGTRLFGSTYPDPFSMSSIGTFIHVSSTMDGGSSPVHKDENTINIEDCIVHSVDINTKPTSYAGATSGNTNQSSDTSSFHHLVAKPVFDRVNISIPHKVVEKAKHGLKRIMMNAKGFCFFKFDSRAGLEAILEGGPWMIRNSPIILKKWSMKTSLQKKELTRIPIWVKLHDVPIQVFEEDDISLISTYLGKPIMLDSYTSSTSQILMVPVIPRRLSELNMNGSRLDALLAIYLDTRKVVNRKRNNKLSLVGNKLPRGVPVSKGFQVGKDFAFKPKAPNVGSNGDNGTRDEPNSRVGPSKTNNGGESLNTKDNNARQQDTGKKKISNIASPNPFAALGVDDDKEEEVKNVWDESENLNLPQTGASTPAQTVFDILCRFLEYKGWKWTSNGNLCPKGTRIILGWNDDIVDVMIMAQTNQVIHLQVNIQVGNKALFYSIIYADDYYVSRRVLWHNLVGHASLMHDKPWVLLGDFNAALYLEDHSCGDYQPDIAMREFKECVQRMQVMDVNATSLHFTWNQKPKGSNGILKKIDRIMCNHHFLVDFPGSFAIFQPYRIFDHSPECFRDVVSTGWNLNIHGCAMYRIIKRLKGLKTPLRKLLHDQGNLHDRVNRLYVELDEAQKAIDRNPSCSLLRDEHAYYLLTFKEASLDEERFLRQKSKIEWLKAGDANTAYFYRIVKTKCARNRIKMVRDSSNVVHEGNAVPGAFFSHYKQFLGLEGASAPLDDQGLFTKILANHKAEFMVRNVLDREIKDALFSIVDDKAPGPDGFTATFFKKSWDIVGGEITNAIRDFFSNGNLLKELNHTIITLIPKVSTYNNP